MRTCVCVHQMADPKLNYHFIIGIIVMIALILQPAFGLLHHERFKQVRLRQFWTYVHLFNGRFFITAGIVNGALGLWIAGNWGQLKVAYLAAAGTMWGLWMAVAVWKELEIWWTTGPPWKPYENEGGLGF